MSKCERSSQSVASTVIEREDIGSACRTTHAQSVPDSVGNTTVSRPLQDGDEVCYFVPVFVCFFINLFVSGKDCSYPHKNSPNASKMFLS